jgi:hypothetical protein
MSLQQNPLKILKGKYQVTKNIYVTCYLHILEAGNEEVRTLIKIKSNAFAMIPAGTVLVFNGKDPQTGVGPKSVFSTQVLRVEELDGKSLHICTGITEENRPDLRSALRKPVKFPVLMAQSQALFTAIEGTNQGLTLLYSTNYAMVSLGLERVYEFSVQWKDETYLLPGHIKHIQYDWQSHQHLIGVQFKELSKDQQLILNLLVDPDYVVPISNNAVVDSAAGKISLDV